MFSNIQITSGVLENMMLEKQWAEALLKSEGLPEFQAYLASTSFSPGGSPSKHSGYV